MKEARDIKSPILSGGRSKILLVSGLSLNRQKDFMPLRRLSGVGRASSANTAGNLA